MLIPILVLSFVMEEVVPLGTINSCVQKDMSTGSIILRPLGTH